MTTLVHKMTPESLARSVKELSETAKQSQHVEVRSAGWLLFGVHYALSNGYAERMLSQQVEIAKKMATAVLRESVEIVGLGRFLEGVPSPGKPGPKDWIQ